jgi:superfamily II DNA/RNA helicase
MTFTPARDLFADAQSFPSLFDGAAAPIAAEPNAAPEIDPGTDIAAGSTNAAEPGPANETPALEASSLEAPAHESPAHRAPAPETPAPQAAASESPARPAPADDATPASALKADEIEATFADLGVPRRLVETLHRAGIKAPFPIQAATIPDAIAGRDVLGRGQTGSGKTLAFGLPIIIRLSNAGKARPGHPAALILVPTRELAMQVNDVIAPLARTAGLFSRTAFGGSPYDKQIRDLRRGVDILVATPGRLGDLIEKGECSLDDIATTVLDEADQMADMGFLPDVTALMDKTPSHGQRLLFSATLDGDVDALVRRFLHDPVTHSVDPSSAAVSTMEHHLLLIPPREKNDIVAAIGARAGRTIMFVRTQMAVDRLADQLAAVGVRAGALHGGKTQRVRTRTLAEFREGRINVLVATDVAARGIHVDGVSLVVHIDPPKDAKDYLHRAGRTARAGEAGTVATLVLPRQRKSTYSMLERAGVTPGRTEVRIGGPELGELTGAREPSGVPVRRDEASTNGRDGRGDRNRAGDRPYRDRSERSSWSDRPPRPRRESGSGDRPRVGHGDAPRTYTGDRPYRGVRDERAAHRTHDDRTPHRMHDDRSPARESAGRRPDGAVRDEHRHRPVRDDRSHGHRPRFERRSGSA